MIVYIIKSPEYSSEQFRKLLDLLRTYFGSNTVFGSTDYTFNYLTDDSYKTFDEFFEVCNSYRNEYSIDSNDYVFLLTEHKNTLNHFSSTDKSLRNFYIQTSDWDNYFNNLSSKILPVLYEIVTWILRVNMYGTLKVLYDSAHKNPKGCVMDFCSKKADIILKMRTGDVCNDCINLIQSRQIDIAVLGPIFNAMDKIQQGLKYRERDEILGLTKGLFINFNEDKPRIKFSENQVKLMIQPRELLFYLLVYLKGNFTTDQLNDENTKRIMKILYNKIKGGVSPAQLNSTIKFWTEDTDGFNEASSKIKSFFIKLLGTTISPKYYIIRHNDGVHRIELPTDNFEINNLPIEITQLLQN